MAKVSVIMPVYNGAKYISEAIESVCAQTYKDWELIVIDDGSTDETQSIVTSLNLPLRLLKQSNLGPSAARNLGLQSATGSYVAFLDADDLWDKNFLTMTVKELDCQDISVVGVCSGWVYTDQNGAELSHTFASRMDYLELQDFLITNPFPIHAILSRRDSLLSANGFDTQILAMEDWDLWLRLCATGCKFYAIETCLAKYRLHGFTNSYQTDKMRAGRLKALENLFARNDLPVAVQLLKPDAFGRALAQSSVELYAADRETEALSNLHNAVQIDPKLLENDEVLYAIICAKQPVGYKSMGERLDLVSSEHRIIRAIQVVLETADVKKTKRIYSRAYLVLGRLAYAQRQMKITRHYICLAVKSDIRCIPDRGVFLLLAKSIIGIKALDILRYLKEHPLVRVN